MDYKVHDPKGAAQGDPKGVKIKKCECEKFSLFANVKLVIAKNKPYQRA